MILIPFIYPIGLNKLFEHPHSYLYMVHDLGALRIQYKKQVMVTHWIEPTLNHDISY